MALTAFEEARKSTEAALAVAEEEKKHLQSELETMTKHAQQWEEFTASSAASGAAGIGLVEGLQARCRSRVFVGARASPP